MVSQGTPTGGLRVLIVEDDTLVGVGIGKMLEKLGYVVVGHASTADEARQMFRDLAPQVVLMDIRLDGTDGITLAEAFLAERRCPIVILSAYSDTELIRRAGAAGVFGYLIKPVAAESLAAQLEVALQRFAEQQGLIREKQELQETLETRKLVERAKGIFMKRLNIGEAEAHRRVQLEAQKRRINMNQMARRIIEMEELLEVQGEAAPAKKVEGTRLKDEGGAKKEEG